jgi:hypothetical protein
MHLSLQITSERFILFRNTLDSPREKIEERCMLKYSHSIRATLYTIGHRCDADRILERNRHAEGA